MAARVCDAARRAVRRFVRDRLKAARPDLYPVVRARPHEPSSRHDRFGRRRRGHRPGRGHAEGDGRQARARAGRAGAAPSAKPMTQVLVAKRDLAIGDRLAAGDVAWQPWPSDTVNAAFITNGAADPVPTKASAKAAKAVGDAAEGMIGGVTPKRPSRARSCATRSWPANPSRPARSSAAARAAICRWSWAPASAPWPCRSPPRPRSAASSCPATASTSSRPATARASARARAARPSSRRRDHRPERPRAGPGPDHGGRKDAKTIVASTATLEVGPVEAEALTRAKAAGPVTLTLRAYTDLGGPSGLAVPSQDSAVVRINRGGQTSSISVRP
jgi:pilus assembly protein CpaB